MLAARVFRAGSAYELVLFDRLEPAEQAALLELRKDPDFYGILRPRESGRTVRAVGKDTALLWMSLREPGPLPSFVLDTNPDAALHEIGKMVLDGVLELEKEGAWVSGSAAVPLLGGARSEAVTGRLGALSRAALVYADHLGLSDADRLAGRLYGYGRLPLTPAREKQVPDAAGVLRFVDPTGSLARRMAASGWRASHEDARGWLSWGREGSIGRAPGAPVCKLYVSPHPEDVPAAVQAVADSLSEQPGARFKIGADAGGLLRPDKLVAYFGELEDLLRCAERVQARIAGIRPHGVPFSAEIGLDGALSWGMDPPASERVLSWQEVESWRLWVVRRVAAAMVSVHSASGGVSASEFALERLRVEGVDTVGWVPSPALWGPSIGGSA